LLERCWQHRQRHQSWIRNAADEWHYLLPNGELYRWEGSFESSTLLAELGSEVYDDPSLLTDAQPMAVVVEYVDGQLTVTPQANFVGEFELRITATDGVANATEIVLIEVNASTSSLDSAFANWNELAEVF
jgi:hypothetical protein